MVGELRFLCGDQTGADLDAVRTQSPRSDIAVPIRDGSGRDQRHVRECASDGGDEHHRRDVGLASKAARLVGFADDHVHAGLDRLHGVVDGGHHVGDEDAGVVQEARPERGRAG